MEKRKNEEVLEMLCIKRRNMENIKKAKIHVSGSRKEAWQHYEADPWRDNLWIKTKRKTKKNMDW